MERVCGGSVGNQIKKRRITDGPPAGGHRHFV